jgi:hypothetical protein
MPAYLLWANEREADGWQFVFGEQSQSQALSWQDGGIELYGRLDRVDENAQGERALLDYKTRSVASLRQKVKEEDDHQLAFYGLLAGGAIEQAHYVALELGSDKKTGDAAAPDFLRKQDMLKQQITTTCIRWRRVRRYRPMASNRYASTAICAACAAREPGCERRRDEETRSGGLRDRRQCRQAAQFTRAACDRVIPWWWKPAPAAARPGCWWRACCACCSRAPRRQSCWPSPSPARPRRKCANA